MVIGYSDGSAYESSSHEAMGQAIPQEPDYDMEGFQASGQLQAENGHYSDDYKLPNHITFSDQSLYHGQDGEEGGHWARSDDNRWAFTPGASNFKHHSLEEMQDYFKKYEPGNVLNAQAGDVIPLRIPANDNKNLQIPDDPYTMASINKQWSDMVKKGRQPILTIVPGDKK